MIFLAFNSGIFGCFFWIMRPSHGRVGGGWFACASRQPPLRSTVSQIFTLKPPPLTSTSDVSQHTCQSYSSCANSPCLFLSGFLPTQHWQPGRLSFTAVFCQDVVAPWRRRWGEAGGRCEVPGQGPAEARIQAPGLRRLPQHHEGRADLELSAD